MTGKKEIDSVNEKPVSSLESIAGGVVGLAELGFGVAAGSLTNIFSLDLYDLGSSLVSEDSSLLLTNLASVSPVVAGYCIGAYFLMTGLNDLYKSSNKKSIGFK